MRSDPIVWNCEATPCPWGARLTSNAIVWPLALGPSNQRLGYAASARIYLPAANANGSRITLKLGTATVYAGPPDAPQHRTLATLKAGDTFEVKGLAADEVLSVQGEQEFSYLTSINELPPEQRAVQSPAANEPISAVPARWRCDTPECTGADWLGAVIPWPKEFAHQSNGRSGKSSRSVFAANGQPLYAYMGAWADGCEITVHTGVVLVIEWKRGSDEWRETKLEPGQKYTIRLQPPENGAMIETVDQGGVFTVSLDNCNPVPLSESEPETRAEPPSSNP